MWHLLLLTKAKLISPPSVPRSIIRPFSQRKAWKFGSVSNEAAPTTWPGSLIPKATAGPPRVRRSIITPFCHKKACSSRVGVSAIPTTCPLLFIPLVGTALLAPPRVPRSVFAPFCQRTARHWVVSLKQKAGLPPELVVSATPTTWVELLTALAVLLGPPSVPRSVIAPLFQRKA